MEKSFFSVKLINIIRILMFVVLFIFPAISFAEEKIEGFSAQIKINPDASVLISETIKYDFGDVEKHGIFRNIPISYKAKNGEKNIDIKIESIFRDNEEEGYETSKKGSDLNIKIGKANTTIKGQHTYSIVYTAKGIINSFEDLDELYWNVTGNNWPVSIDNVKTVVELPKNDLGKTDISCYEGIAGSKDKCITKIENNFFTATSSRFLKIGEGLTIAVDFPKGIVDENAVNKIIESEDSPLGFVFWLLLFGAPIITLIVMFFVWKKKGKDSEGLSTIIAEYEPPLNMKPTLVGSLVDEKPDYRDITAGLIYLAEQGFIKIKRLEKEWFLGSVDYELELVKNEITNLEKTEKSILDLFFENNLKIGAVKKISSFKQDLSFAVGAKKIIKDLYQEMTDKGFFVENPMKAKISYIITSSIFLVLGFLFLTFLILPGIIILIFSFFMSKKTKLGAETKDHILGFKLFLSVTEKERLDFHNAPEKNPEQFMEFLPYAIAFGVEKKWAKQFENIYIGQPNWYHSNVVGNFIAIDFINHMSDFSNSVTTGLAPVSKGGGGAGFSGGGFGGGGGGSW